MASSPRLRAPASFVTRVQKDPTTFHHARTHARKHQSLCHSPDLPPPRLFDFASGSLPARPRPARCGGRSRRAPCHPEGSAGSRAWGAGRRKAGRRPGGVMETACWRTIAVSRWESGAPPKHTSGNAVLPYKA